MSRRMDLRTKHEYEGGEGMRARQKAKLLKEENALLWDALKPKIINELLNETIRRESGEVETLKAAMVIMKDDIFNPNQIRHQIASELADYMVKNDVIKFSKRYEQGNLIITGEVKVVK